MGQAREVSVTGAAAGDTRPKATNRMQRWFEDMGTFIAGAVALFVVGSLFLVAAVQSPSMLQWTGTAVRSVESGGLLYYTFHGQSYTLDVTSPVLGSSTVYVDPADPSNAMLSSPLTRWTDIGSVGGPYAASVLLLTYGFTRRARRRRLRDRGLQQSFGSGLDHTTLGLLLDRQRGVDFRGGGAAKMPPRHDEHSREGSRQADSKEP